MREIFDGPDWVEHYRHLSPAKQVVMRKSSMVKRGHQAGGAREPDVGIQAFRWWLECEHSDQASPLRKLQQAERDINHLNEPRWRAASITRKTGSHTTWVCLRVHTFLGLGAKDGLCGEGIDSEGLGEHMMIPYGAFLAFLRAEKARYDACFKKVDAYSHES